MSKPNVVPVPNYVRAAWLDRRVAVRYPGHPDAACVASPPSGGIYPAWVRDISTSGVALLMEREFPDGTVLTIELENAQQGLVRVLRARVVHTLEVPPDERWLHGCAFEEPLTDEDLRGFAG
jgi:hypothetical protein